MMRCGIIRWSSIYLLTTDDLFHPCICSLAVAQDAARTATALTGGFATGVTSLQWALRRVHLFDVVDFDAMTM